MTYDFGMLIILKVRKFCDSEVDTTLSMAWSVLVNKREAEI